MTQDFLTTLKDEITRDAKLTAWRQRRQEILGRVATMYDTRGESFITELESVLESSQRLPMFNTMEMIRRIVN